MNWKAAGIVMLGMAAGNAIAGTPEPPRPLTLPQEWISPEDYPPIALRNEQAGVVAFVLDIDRTGTVVKCTILQSSGFDALDAATCSTISMRVKFAPGRDKQGRPVNGRFSSRVRWQIPSGGDNELSKLPIAFFPGTVKINIDVSADGNVERCEAKAEVVPLLKAVIPDFCIEIGKSKDLRFVDDEGKGVAVQAELNVSANVTRR